jgi:hypothetical protein
MNSPSDFNLQLADLTIKLSGMVAERLAYWSKDMNPPDRLKILEMIESKLPDIIANSIAKTPSLHSSGGVQYLEQNLSEYADAYAKKFIGKL